MGDPSFQVRLFGSWAAGNARPRSDVDVAIDGLGPVDPYANGRDPRYIRPVAYLVYGRSGGSGERRRRVSRGEAKEESDIDLLVVKKSVPHRRQLAQDIYVRLIGIPVPVDVIVVRP